MAPLFLPWTDVSEAAARTLLSPRSGDGARREVLREALRSGERYEGVKEEAFLDMAAASVDFARLHAFDEEKTSTLVSLFATTHRETTSDPQPTVEEAARAFERLVLRHGVHRPPFSVGVFSFPEVKLVVEFGLSTYFRHARLYQFVFGNSVHLDLCVSGGLVERVKADCGGVTLDRCEEVEAVEGATEAEEQEQEQGQEQVEQDKDQEQQEEEGKPKEEEEESPRQKLQAEFEARLAAQKAEFEARLAALEGGVPLA